MATSLRTNLIAVLAVAMALALGTASAQSAPESAQRSVMTDYRNEHFGFSMRVPADVFVPAETRNGEAGSIWVSRDRQARLVAAAQANDTRETVATYRKYLMDETYTGASFDYAPVRDTWFVLSGTMQDGRLFYERVTFACEGRYIYGWQLLYPAEAKSLYDRVVERVHRSYRAGQGPGGKCE